MTPRVVVLGDLMCDVVTVHAQNVRTRDVLDLIGLPCTLHVEGGQPRLSWE